MTAYTLFSQGAAGSNGANPAVYSFGTEFSLSSPESLTGIWFYSPPGADQLPAVCAIFNVGSQTVVSGTQNSSPTWSGAIASGWVKCSYSGSVILPASTNLEVVVQGQGTSAGWYAKTVGYWSSGAGSSGISNGPLSAPSNAAATNGQCDFLAGSFGWPATSSAGNNYWVDVEVTPSTAPVTQTVYCMRMMP